MATSGHNDQALTGVGSWASNITDRGTARPSHSYKAPATSYSTLLDELVTLTPGSGQQHSSTHDSLTQHVQAEDMREKSSMLERHLGQIKKQGQHGRGSKGERSRKKRRRGHDKKGK